jgi:predicted AlkP superfamily pyrophosphatase or phosphodiesterase
MKKKTGLFTALLLWVACLTATAQQPPVKQVILFMIDGLHWQAPEKIRMPVFNNLIREGVYIKESCMIIPHHPTIGDYSKFNSCSFPNPILHEGTIFLSPANKMVQELFSPAQQTAFIVNTVAYETVGRGFSTAVMDDVMTDAQVVETACNILLHQHPVFVRIHLQRAGQRGYDISQSTPDKPYYRNIFGPESPYVKAVEEADQLLGNFVAFLKKEKRWDSTALIVTSDHGQSNIGWHPLFDEDSWKTPLLFVGAGIAQGRRLDYFEHTNLAPTIAGLLGKEWPEKNGGTGIYVDAILKDKDASNYQPKKHIRTLNEQIREYNFLRAELTLASQKDSYFSNAVALLENETFMEPFYHQDRILDWHKAATTDHLIEANEKALQIMRNILSKP